jgi:hypothetical protein
MLTLKGYSRLLNTVCFSPDGKRLASADWDKVKVREASTGREILSLELDLHFSHGICFSPDGQRLASIFNHQTLKVWDAQTGKEILALKGHLSDVESVVFSPDGQRLATASADKTVRVWDAQTGQEVLTLKGHTQGVNCVCFSPDGHRLATASRDGTVNIWDARPLTWEVEAERAALPLVRALFDKLLLRAEVLAALHADKTIPEPIRQQALAMAERYREDAARLNHSSWTVVRHPGASPEQYGLALHWAETACRLQPGDGILLNTLGVAQYRAGKFLEALATLTRSEALNRARLSDSALPFLGTSTVGWMASSWELGSVPAISALLAERMLDSHPTDLAFLAMTCRRLGRTDQAQRYLDRLRRSLTQPQWSPHAEAQGFLREAEKLLTEPAARRPNARPLS